MGLGRCDEKLTNKIETEHANKLKDSLLSGDTKASQKFMDEINDFRQQQKACASAGGVYDKLPDTVKGDVSLREFNPKQPSSEINQPGGHIRFNSIY